MYVYGIYSMYTHVCMCIIYLIVVKHSDQGYKLFRHLRVLGCGDPSEARVLIRAQGSLNNLYPDLTNLEPSIATLYISISFDGSNYLATTY